MAARVEKARVPSSLYVCFKLFLGFGFDKNLYICLQFAMVCLFSMFVLVLVGTGPGAYWSWCARPRGGATGPGTCWSVLELPDLFGHI